MFRTLMFGLVTLFFIAGCSKTQTNPANNLNTLDLSRVVPNTLGILVHDSSDANLDRAVQGGFKVIRMDLTWYAVESVKGQYYWSEYDAIVSRLKARGLRPLFILNFNNPNYGAGSEMDGIDTPQEREGFKKFAVAAVNRFQDLINPLWEIYNEPNRPTFWSDPSALEYMNLIKIVVPAMRQAKPNLFIMAPGLGHAPALDGTDNPIKVDFGYLESTFALGILNHVDAISIHPYPDGEPEVALGIYDDVRSLMKMYQKTLPIVSSEWGYSSAAAFANTPQGHANYLTRMYLINLSQDVLSFGYKLEAGSPDPSADDYELGFSWFNANGSAKPVYSQVKTMIQTLKGLSFVKQLPSSDDDYLMEFSNGTKTIVAAWTTLSAHTVNLYGKSVKMSGKPIYVSN
jgi:polysaccharide biosynthesis protein PslG